ncbi:unnamed protein product [Cylindrotheca closterium]|uniref:SET domain-containing protein n=1 Tax=Cylindrotheca closterium TaxID=2856 RepID=A0AAD2FXD1_9STRA|nr:unnamed protein product [Cylindrotheca closterium]
MESAEIMECVTVKNGDNSRIIRNYQSSYKWRRRRDYERAGIRNGRRRFPQGQALPCTSAASLFVTIFVCCSLVYPSTLTCQARTIRQRHPGTKQRQGNRNESGGGDHMRSMPSSMTNDGHGHLDERTSAFFFQWIRRVWKVDTSLVELKEFQYSNYVEAMKDKVDVFYDEDTRYYNSYHQIGEGRGGLDYWEPSDSQNGEAFETGHQGDRNKDNGMAADDSEIQNGMGNDSNHDRDNGSWEDNGDDDDADDDDKYLSVLDYPPVSTRGLAATRDIEAGEIILQIPHAALWTVSNRIDNDPILSEVLGFEARLIHSWDAPSDEIPLLAVALLYNFELWRHADEEQGESPHGAYLQLLDDINVHDLIPHLWDSKTLRRSTTVGVRKVAKAIQKDVKELYQRIMVPLIEEHPQIFGNYQDTYTTYEDDEEEFSSADGDDGLQKEHYRDEEWLFSLERFHWAFALVNSRHWHLPIPDEAKPTSEGDTAKTDSEDQIDENGSPPASMPTDEWMDLQQEMEHRRDEEERRSAEEESHHNGGSDEWAVGNSFLAPLADLLNFGPPSTRGVYNATTHTFDIVATGPIAQGQEITFWYVDACQDVFMANYGFTMPMMVPPCESQRYHNDETGGRFLSTAQFAQRLEQELLSTLDELDHMDDQMEHLVGALKLCDCTPGTHESPDQPKHTPSGSPVPSNGNYEQQRPGRRPPKRTDRNYGDRNQARHAIRGADHNSPVSSIRNADSRRSESLSRSQKRKRRNDNMSSARDL